MRLLAVLLLCTLLSGCNHSPEVAQPRPPQLFQDDHFVAPPQPVSRAEVFALSEPMQRYLDTEIAAQLRDKGRLKGLLAALYRQGQLKLEYDSSVTKNAAEAFVSRSGNCLSLVIMTAAFAKALELPVEFQSALIDESWSRSGGLYLLSGHVNVTLGRRLMDARSRRDAGQSVTVDFLPPEDVRGLRTRVVSEDTIVAMYMNNRAAETLVQGRTDEAYWWAREAVVQDPGFTGAYNTLGVVYLRRGLAGPAERAWREVLRRDANNTRALANLAQLLAQQGRPAEALPLQRRLSTLEAAPPYRYFELGMAALRTGDAEAARAWFEKEVARDPYQAEFHFWLGVAQLRLGRAEVARRQLELALESSTTADERGRYAAKLARLRADGRPVR
ncbi:tetratricopeptide repeat protein [Eleftheria terrae]|uniref:tetratricopeptide repeat protein n=1 Tax=Eleftheria terrae TaxID=1597781 RepID=UPI00263BBBF0|nr:tetratricopeptide repeat protein [Eleftheria terrae]WKB55835.1 tetratricopeptide repeat protein [Eleftheria terrae]